MATHVSGERDYEEQIARIRQLLTDSDKSSQKVGLAPWTIVMMTIGTQAVMFAAAAAFVRIMLS